MNEILRIHEAILRGGKAVVDSRLVKTGDVFFALKGETLDGNIFAKAAIDSGAAIAVIDNPEYLTEGALLVADVLDSLQQTAQHYRATLGIPILAITGSNGKTTTKELLSCVLSKKYSVASTKGNLNNHIGVPLTILSFDRSTELGVVEMGANHKLEIGRLAEIAQPNFGIITNIGKAHLEGFGSVEGIMVGKGELYDFLAAHDGLAFYSADNSFLNKMVGMRPNLKTIPFSREIHRARLLEPTILSPYLQVEVEGFGSIATHLFGEYNFENVLAAITIGRFFEVPDYQIREAIESFEPSNNRSQIATTDKNIVLLDCYNANPSSMRAALEGVSKVDHHSKVAILGDMLELGEYSLKEHREMVELAIRCGFQHIYLVGATFKKASVGLNLDHFATQNDLSEHLLKNPVRNSFVLVKGSRGIQLEKIFDKL